MEPRIAIIAAGAMGSGVGRRLKEHGACVLTSIEGRGPATVERAKTAGMIAASDAEIAEADIILSILPPADAVALAERFAGVLAKSQSKPIFVDCNAIDVATVAKVERIIAATGAPFVDGAIIGTPPAEGKTGPRFYFSGAAAKGLAKLAELGLEIRIMDGDVGAASTLKMSYAGITKGLTALAAAMILAANRAGAAKALHAELAESQSQLLTRFATTLPQMYPKAYRFAGEMEEIAAFLKDDKAASTFFDGAAQFYERLGRDYRGDKREIGMIEAFLKL